MIKMVLFISLALFPLLSRATDSFTVKFGNEETRLKLISKANTDLQIDVYINGKLKQSFEGLGKKFQNLTFQGKENSLVAVDLDQDGNREIIIRTELPPVVGGVWVFRWDKEKHLLAHALTEAGDRYIPVPSTGPVEVLGNGDLTFGLSSTGITKTFHWMGNGYKEKVK